MIKVIIIIEDTNYNVIDTKILEITSIPNKFDILVFNDESKASVTGIEHYVEKNIVLITSRKIEILTTIKNT